MRRVLTGVPGAGATPLVLAFVLWFGLFVRADAFQAQQTDARSQQSNQQSQQSNPRSDAALFDLFRPQQSGAQGTVVSAYANDADTPRVYRRHRYLHHARHHRREDPEKEVSGSSASDSSVPSSAPLADAKQTWEIATAPGQVQPDPSVVSTFQIVMITQDGGDPFERCMTAYYWSHLNHAWQADQVFDPARRYVVDATSPDVTGHLAASWIQESVGR